MSERRIPWYTPDELDDRQRELYDAIAGGRRAQGRQAFPMTDDDGRLHGPFNLMLASPAVGTALQGVGVQIRYGEALSHRAREIAILELSAQRKSSFEWYAHARLGRIAGLTHAEIAALRDGKPAVSFTPDERLVRETVDVLLRERDLDDALYAAAERALGREGLVDLIVLVGYYDLLALLMRVDRTPLPDGEPSPFPEPA